MLNKIVSYLQTRSYQTKGRILAAAIAVTMIGLGTVWINNLKHKFADISTPDLNLSSLQPGQVLGASNFITLEATEVREGKRYIYFKVENNTDEILNFPSKDKISLKVGNQTLEPEAVQTRQQQPFVVKVLNKTTNFGVMVFPEFKEDKGELTIRELNLEQKNEFSQQTIKIDFDKLNPLEELRS